MMLMNTMRECPIQGISQARLKLITNTKSALITKGNLQEFEENGEKEFVNPLPGRRLKMSLIPNDNHQN